MKALEVPSAVYKVEFEGTTHYIVGSCHSNYFEVSKAAADNMTPVLQTIAQSVVAGLVVKNAINNVYLEAMPDLRLGELAGMDYQIYSQCKKLDPSLNLKEIENPMWWTAGLKETAVALGVEDELYRFNTQWPMLSVAAVYSPGVLAIGTVSAWAISRWGWNRAGKFGAFVGFIGVRAICEGMHQYLYDKAIAQRYPKIITGFNDFKYMLSSYGSFVKAGVEETPSEVLEGDYLKEAKYMPAFNARNEWFAKVIMEEKKPSLFCYGHIHNLSGCEDAPSVLDLLERHGAKVTPYKSYVDFNQEFGIQ